MTRTIHYMPHNEMRIEDIRRVLRNFVSCMPKAYRRRTRNAKVVMDIIQDGTGQAGYTSCVKVCEKSVATRTAINSRNGDLKR